MKQYLAVFKFGLLFPLAVLIGCSGDSIFDTISDFDTIDEVKQYSAENQLESSGQIPCESTDCTSKIVVMLRDIETRGVMSKQQRITLRFTEDGELIDSTLEDVWLGP